jgi:hypothetical protein
LANEKHQEKTGKEDKESIMRQEIELLIWTEL